jgi:hypothetical protein
MTNVEYRNNDEALMTKTDVGLTARPFNFVIFSGLHFEQQHRHIHFVANFVRRRAVEDVTD